MKNRMKDLYPEKAKVLLSTLLLLFGVFLSSCVNNNDNNGKPYVKYDFASLRLTPKTIYVLPSQSVQVYGEGGSGYYTFSVSVGSNLGSIDSSTGIFTAGPTAGVAVVVGTDSAGAQAAANVVILEELLISPENGFVTTSSSLQMVATGGLPPYTFSLASNYGGSINPITGLLTAPATFGYGVVQVEDAAGNKTFTEVRFIQPLTMLPATGYFSSSRPLQLTRIGGEGTLTYEFLQGEGIAEVDTINNILTPNVGSAGLVQLKIKDELNYSTTINLNFFVPKSIAMGKRHACAVDIDSSLYCWGGNDRGQSAATKFGPNIGDDPDELDGNLRSMDIFTNIIDIAVTGHNSCILYDPANSGNRMVRCWGSKDNVYANGAWGDNMGTWSEQNYAYGLGTVSNLYMSNTGDHSYLNFIQGSGYSAYGGYWDNIEGNSGDLRLRPAGVVNDNTFGETSLRPYLSMLIPFPNYAVSDGTGNGTLGNFVSNGFYWYTSDGANIGRINSGSPYDFIARFRNSSTASTSESLYPYMGPIKKFSFAVNGSTNQCFVMKITGALAGAYVANYGGKNRIICTGPNYSGVAGIKCNNASCLTNYGNFTSANNSPNHNDPRIYTYNNNYFSFGNQSPEIASIFVAGSNDPGEKEALDVEVVTPSTYERTACGIFDDTSGPSGKKIAQCWGSNLYGLLGIGDSNGANHLSRPPFSTWDGGSSSYKVRYELNFNTVSAGTRGTLDLPAFTTPEKLFSNHISTFCLKTTYDDGMSTPYDKLFCWGDNGWVQATGDSPSSYSSPAPVAYINSKTAAGAQIMDVQMSHSHTCAVLNEAGVGTIYCWGDTRFGVLHKQSIGATDLKSGPTRIKLGGSFNVKDMSVGSGHACAVSTTDSIKCWGARYFGQLGVYTSPVEADEPFETSANLNKVSLTVGNYAKEVYAGYNHTCVVMDGVNNGQVFCFGANRSGELGRSDIPGQVFDVGIRDKETVDGVKTLDATALGVHADNPLKPSVVTKISAVYANFAMTDDGKLFSWGQDAGTTDTRNTAVTGTNFAVSWTNLLGRGSSPGLISQPLQMPISSLKVIDVSTSDAFACAVVENGQVQQGEVHCWGDNSRRQMGRLTPTAYPASAVVSGMGAEGNSSRVNLGSDFTAIAVTTGQYHACALSNMGKIKCWGNNKYGQLGLSYSTTRPNPVPYASLSEMGNSLPTVLLGNNSKGQPQFVTQIAAGEYHTCALTDEGRVVCWGNNSHGQLGIGTTNNVGIADNQMGSALTYVAFPSGTVAIQILAKGNNSCALLSSNNVVCWGDNTVAQLGLGDRNPRGINKTTIGNGFNTIQFPE